MPSGLFHINYLDRFISNKRSHTIWLVFIVTLFYSSSCPKCKQCIFRSDAAFCGVWSVSTLFDKCPCYGKLSISGLIYGAWRSMRIRGLIGFQGGQLLQNCIVSIWIGTRSKSKPFTHHLSSLFFLEKALFKSGLECRKASRNHAYIILTPVNPTFI